MEITTPPGVKNMTEPTGQPSKLETPIQPPDFLLPRAGLQRAKRAKFFLSWGGEVYGPTTESEILAGMRASSFGEDALYWREGSEGWRPLAEFLSDNPMAPPEEWLQQGTEEPPAIPETPGRSQGSVARTKRGHRPSRKAAPRPQGGRSHAPLVIFGIVILAVLLTVSMLLLLMRIG